MSKTTDQAIDYLNEFEDKRAEGKAKVEDILDRLNEALKLNIFTTQERYFLAEARIQLKVVGISYVRHTAEAKLGPSIYNQSSTL